MFLRCLAASLLLVLSTSAHNPTYRAASTQEGIPADEYPEMVRIDCLIGVGSGFMVGPRIGISANHVTSLQGCFIGGKPFKVVSHVGDFSIFEAPEDVSKWLTIDCGGYEAHKRYEALGFARGLDTLTEVDLHATGQSAHVQPNGGTDDVMAILEGVWTVIPGQSGGAVLDPDTHKVVGVVNTYDMEGGLSGSVELKRTSVCRNA